MYAKANSKLCWFGLLALLLAATQVQARSLPDFVDLAKSNSPAVVNISTHQSHRDARDSFEEGFDAPDGMEIPELFRRFLEKNLPQMPEREERSLGSGFIISEDGYILTNSHVVDDADTVEVRLSDRRVYEASVVGADKGSDIALVKIDADGLPKVKIGESKNLQVGEWVLAIGSPFGFDHTVTAGIVSAKGRSLPSENYVPFIQTDVAINPGNSGGPLFNLDGEVVGINAQIYSRTGGFMGLSFAIPIELAMDVAKQLRETGTVERGYLGVLIQDVNRDLAESFGLDQPRGALVSKVLPDTPAAEAGLQVGDIIVEFNGQNISRSGELPPLVGVTPIDTKVPLKVIRDGKTVRLKIQIARLPGPQLANQSATEAKPQLPGSITRLGMRVMDLTDQARQESGLESGGAMITELQQGPASAAGLQIGDVIKMYDRQRIDSAEQLRDLVAASKPNSTVAVLILRDGDPVFMPLRVGE